MTTFTVKGATVVGGTATAVQDSFAVQPPAPKMLWGTNLAEGSSYLVSGSETYQQQYDRVVATFGRCDIQKIFYSPLLPTTMAANGKEATVTKNGAVAMVCYKSLANASTWQDLKAGKGNTALQSYLRSLTAGHYMLVWWQEPDNDMSDGGLKTTGPFTKAEYRDTANYLADVIHGTSGLKAGVTVEATACFQYYPILKGVWTDDRVPTHCDSIGWDTYLNPPPAINTSSYETPASNPSTFAAQTKAIAERLGFKGKWGWPEIGCPWRTGDTSGSGRAGEFTKLLTDLRDAGAAFGILWDVNIGQWDHRIISKKTTPAPATTAANVPVATGQEEPAVSAVRTVFAQ